MSIAMRRHRVTITRVDESYAEASLSIEEHWHESAGMERFKIVHARESNWRKQSTTLDIPAESGGFDVGGWWDGQWKRAGILLDLLRHWHGRGRRLWRKAGILLDLLRHWHGRWGRLWEVTGQMLDRLQEWQERARERAMLRGLDDGALKDFGVSRADAEGEAEKPFWKE